MPNSACRDVAYAPLDAHVQPPTLGVQEGRACITADTVHSLVPARAPIPNWLSVRQWDPSYHTYIHA
eukprot:50884-Eustigmatos_ZCMA.PRE.1